MSADKPPGESEFDSSDDEMSEKTNSPAEASSVGTRNAVEGKQVQVNSEIMTGTPSTLADLPSTEIQSILIPDELTPLENDEAFRWRGQSAHKAAPTNDDKTASLSPSVLKDLPSTSTVVSLHLEQPELKPTTKASDAFLFEKIRPQIAQKKQQKVKLKPPKPPHQQFQPTFSPNRQIVLKKGETKTPKNAPKTVAKFQGKTTKATNIQAGKSAMPNINQIRQTPPMPPPTKHNQTVNEQTKIQKQKLKTAKQQATPASSPKVTQIRQSPFPRKEFPARVTPSSPIKSGRLRSSPGRTLRTTPVVSVASPGIAKAAKKTKQTQTAISVKVEKAKTAAKDSKTTTKHLFTSYIFRPPPKE